MRPQLLQSFPNIGEVVVTHAGTASGLTCDGIPITTSFKNTELQRLILTKMNNTPSSTIHNRAFIASIWIVGYKPLGIALQLIRSLVLTRLLFPEAFGLMALVGVLLQGLQMCSDVGINPNIIQSKRGNDPTFLCTAWTVQIIRGLCLWLICCGLAWPMSYIYGQPMLLTLLPVAGLNLLISGFNTTSYATFSRHINVGRPLIVDFAVQSINLVIIILFAWWLRSVWALVIGGLCGSLIQTLLGHKLLPGIHHRFQWDRQAVRELVYFGTWVFISTSLTFFAMQIDKVLLGKLVSVEMLGVYSIALVLANLPRDLLQSLSGSVLFPALAEKNRDDSKRMHQRVIYARGILLRGGIVLTAGVIAVAPAFFLYLYDSRYSAASWLAQFLAVSGWMTALNVSAGSVLLSLGATSTLALGNFFNVIMTVIGCLLGNHYFGLPGFIGGYTFGTACGQLFQVWRLQRFGIYLWRQDVSCTLVVLCIFIALLGIFSILKVLCCKPSAWLQTSIGLVIWCGIAGIYLPGLRKDLFPEFHIAEFFSRVNKRFS